ncbi:MAG: molybdopterin-guanine dinucleotide biosynthesis protein B [Alphaproteobacteria bacterium]
MRVFGLAGWSGSGKTTLVMRLLPELARRGVTASTIKHAHDGFDIDQPGKDSYEHRQAGAREVLVASNRRWALLHENQQTAEPDLAGLIARLSPVDLVLVEGFKTYPHDKLEVHRPALGKPLLCADDRRIIAVATDQELAGVALPMLDLDDAAAIADFIITHCGLGAVTRSGVA